MKKKLLVGVGAVSVVVVGLLVQTMHSAGSFRTLEPHFAGSCTRVDGVVGAEDITIDPLTGLAYISAMDRRTLAATGEHKGGIYTYMPGSFETPVKMASDLEADFHPHGIGLWKSPDNNDRLFVITHPLVEGDDGDLVSVSQIDLFDIDGSSLSHVRSVRPKEHVSLNDITAAGPDRFYASIDRGSVTKLGRTLEVYGRLARAGVLYGDRETTRKVLGGLVYANGVQMNRTGDILYVAETTGKRLSSYAVDPETGDLNPLEDTEINSGLDNIELGLDGSLWVVGHPKTFDFLAHADNAANRSPSQVFRITLGKEGLRTEEIYLNDGNPISGASVAAPYADRFLIGSVFEPFILDCSL